MCSQVPPRRCGDAECLTLVLREVWIGYQPDILLTGDSCHNSIVGLLDTIRVCTTVAMAEMLLTFKQIAYAMIFYQSI